MKKTFKEALVDWMRAGRSDILHEPKQIPTMPETDRSVSKAAADLMAGALKEPCIYVIKRGGDINVSLGSALEVDDLKRGFLFRHCRVITCGDPECDCTEKAWREHARGVEVVRVKLVEVSE